MSDGHSDSARYSRFYEASKKIEEEKTESKIKKMCVVLKDNTIVSLDGVQLLYSEKYDKTVVDAMALPTYFVNRLKSAQFKRQQKSDVKTWYAMTHTLKGTYTEKRVLKGDEIKGFKEKGITRAFDM